MRTPLVSALLLLPLAIPGAASKAAHFAHSPTLTAADPQTLALLALGGVSLLIAARKLRSCRLERLGWIFRLPEAPRSGPRTHWMQATSKRGLGMVAARNLLGFLLLAIAMTCPAVAAEDLTTPPANTDELMPFFLGTQDHRPRIIIPSIGWRPLTPDPDDPGDPDDDPITPGGTPRDFGIFTSNQLVASMGAGGSAGGSALDQWVVASNNGLFPIQGSIVPTPEPSTLLMLLAGIGLLTAAVARRRQSST